MGGMYLHSRNSFVEWHKSFGRELFIGILSLSRRELYLSQRNNKEISQVKNQRLSRSRINREFPNSLRRIRFKIKSR